MKHKAVLKEHELTWNMMNQVWELTAIIEADGKDMQLYFPLSNYPRRMYIKLCEEKQQLKELLKECRNYINKVAFCTPNCYKTLMEDLLTKIDNAIGEKK